jgi:hypothetical protein
VVTVLDQVGGDASLEPGIVLGHGVGVDQDPPTLHAIDASALELGNVLSVHPHLRFSEVVDGALADVLHVGEETAEGLSGLPRALTILE